MSSRLFQEIREKRGLAYSVYSFASHHAGAGLFGVYAGCQPAKAHEVIDIMRAELADVAAHGMGEDEIGRGKGQMRGGLVLGLEDSTSRMSRIGKSELSFGEVLEVDELLRRVEAVTAADVAALAADLLDRPRCLTVVGPFAGTEFGTTA
jgi:predicted Zn-dependent peptidase